MKRFQLAGEQFCRAFTTNTLAVETTNTLATEDIDRERQLMDFKRKMAAVRADCVLAALNSSQDVSATHKSHVKEKVVAYDNIIIR